MLKLWSVLRVKAEFLHLSEMGAGVDQGPSCRISIELFRYKGSLSVIFNVLASIKNICCQAVWHKNSSSNLFFFLYTDNWVNFLLTVFCRVWVFVLHDTGLYTGFLFFSPDTAPSKSGAPENVQTKISSFCFSQKSELELPKTEVSKETNNVRTPTDSGAVPIFPLEMEPESGRYRGGSGCNFLILGNKDKLQKWDWDWWCLKPLIPACVCSSAVWLVWFAE